MSKKRVSWKLLKRICACLVLNYPRKDLLESLNEASQINPKWKRYAEEVAKHDQFLAEMFRNNPELLESQMDAGMRIRARGLTKKELNRRIRLGIL
tara:strand:- start:76 stop:363 length:288 start_codon:yes stop_codon:yes gene_type:complete